MKNRKLANETLDFVFHVLVLQEVKVFFGKQILYLVPVGG